MGETENPVGRRSALWEQDDLAELAAGLEPTMRLGGVGEGGMCARSGGAAQPFRPPRGRAVH